MRPPLSIVIPTRNTRDLVLRSVLSVDLNEAEILVVDDASGDGTAEALAGDVSRPVTVLRNDAPLRFTGSANRGLGEARGEILLLLNSDTEIEPGGLARLLQVFRTEPALGVAGARLHYPDGSPQWSGGREPTLTWFFALSSGLPALLERLPLGFYRRARPLDAAAPRRVDWVTGAAMAFRRRVWETLGPLDERFAFYAQDLDFCLRARRAGWEVAVRPELRVLHHHGATIGQTPGARRRQNPLLLWSDLLLWAEKARGAAWANRAERALRRGALLRLTARWLARPFLSSSRRAAWREDDRTLRSTLAALKTARRR